jgi:hypothetical protein
MTNSHSGEMNNAQAPCIPGAEKTQQPRHRRHGTARSMPTYGKLHSLAAEVLDSLHRVERASPSGQSSGVMDMFILRAVNSTHWHLMIRSGDVRLEGSTGTACQLRARAIYDAMHPDALARRLAPSIPAPLDPDVQAVLDFLGWTVERTRRWTHPSGTEAEEGLLEVRILRS